MAADTKPSRRWSSAMQSLPCEVDSDSFGICSLSKYCHSNGNDDTSGMDQKAGHKKAPGWDAS